MRLALATVMAISLLGLDAAGCSQKGPSGLPTIPLEVGGHRLKVEVASTAAEHSRGLMYRRELEADHGMLFIYDRPDRLSFWMKNTFVPLTVAFLDEDGTIVQMDDMHPQTTQSHRSKTAVRYALEVNQGWFRERGIDVGTKTQFEWNTKSR